MQIPKSRRLKKFFIPIASLGLLIGVLSPVPNAFAANLTTPSFRTVAGTTSVVLTMSGGTCSLASSITSASFTFGGTNATALALGTFTRTSNTVVTITGLTVVAATNNTITVPTLTQATACSGASALSVPIAVTSATFNTSAGGTSVRVTLSSGTYKAAPIAATDFTFAGTNAAALALGTFTRTSNSTVTITGLTVAAASNNVVTVLAATQATQATAVTGSVVAYSLVTSLSFATVAGGTSVTITLSGGSFISGTISASNFVFGGLNSSTLATGTFTRTSSTVVTITGLTVIAASNNTVQVPGASQASQASSVSGAAVPYSAVTSPSFSTAAGTTTLTITLSGGTFKTGTIAAADFIFAGGDSARLALGTFTRTSSTLVTITLLTGLVGGVNNTVQVLPATQSTQVTSVLGAAPTHTVTYNSNGGTGTPPTQSPVSEGSGFLTALGTGFTKTGFNFTNWNTAANGSGTSYAEGSSFTMGILDVTLYAQWAIATFAITVTPAINGTITPGSAVVNYGLGSSNYIFNPATGYSVSSIVVDGSALSGATLTTAISSGYVFTNVTSTHTLAAIFILNSITWNDQGATTPSSGGSSNYTIATPISTIPTVAPLKSGYTFAGWNTAANGSGSLVTDGSYTPPFPYGPITIYAQWSAVTNNPITWNDLGATTASSGGSSTYTTATAISAIPTVAPLKSGYTFAGWNTTADGSGTPVSAGSYTPVTPFGAITIYAQWSANTNNVIYNDQGGSGQSGGASTYISGSNFVLPTTPPTKVGYNFTGWFLATTGGSALGATYTPSSPFPDITIYAQWSAISYNVTYDDQGGSGQSGGASTYSSGSNFVLPTTPPTQAGYTFLGWYLATTGGSVLGANYTPVTPFGAITIYAQWSANTNNVIYNDQGGSGQSGGASTYISGSNFVLPTTPPTKVGYTFTGWFLATTGGSALGATYTPSSPFPDITIYAQWSAISYNVTYDDQGGSGQSGGASTYSSGSNFVLPTTPPTQAGYTFLGWYLATTGGSVLGANYTPVTPFGAITIYAQWSANTNNVIYNDQGGSGQSGGASTYISGSNFVLPTTPPTKVGYTFTGWFLATTGGSALGATYTPSSPFPDITIYAQWSAISYNVTYDDQGGSGQSGGASTYSSGSNFVLPTTPPTQAGYTFLGWYLATTGGSVLGANYTPVTPFGAITIYAQWSANTNNVIYNDQGGSGQSGGASTYISGSNFVLPTTPPTKVGYTFTGWFLATTGGSALGATYTPSSPFPDITIYAQWSAISYNVTYDDQGGSGQSGGASTYSSGSNFVLPTTPPTQAGYTFLGWYLATTGGSVLGANYTPVTPFGAITIYAQWSANTNNVIYNDQGGSGQSGGASTYISGSNFVLPTTPPTKVGYTFTGWFLATTGGSALGATYTPSSPFPDITIYAQWSAISYNVTYDDQGGSGQSGGASTYSSGSNFVLPTTPPTQAGYTFLGWYLATTGGSVLGANYTPVTPFGAITIYAQWSANTNNVIYNDQGGSGQSGGASTYISGSNFVLPTTPPTKVGYTFTGWFLATTGGSALGATYTPSSPFPDITIYAQWSAISYNVTYDDQGGSGQSGGASTYSSGSNFVLPTTPPTQAGYTFLGWYLATTGGSVLGANYTPVTPFGAITIYAQWSANTNNVIYNDQGGSGQSGGASTYISGSNFVLPTTPPTKVGYTFTGWFLATTGGSALGATYTPSSPFPDITIYAQWSAISYNVTYDDQGGSGQSGGASTYSSGSNFVLPTTPPTQAGYTFLGWYLATTGGSVLGANYTPVTPFGAITIYAQWSAGDNNVIYDNQGGAGQSGGDVSYISGSSFSLPTTPPTRVGYNFVGWFTDALGGSALGSTYTPLTPFGNVTIYAQWSADNNAVIYDDQGGSGESGGAVTYLSGSNFVLPTTPPTKAGYSFTGWFLAPTGGSALISPYTPLTPFGTITIYAQWSANSNNVSYDDQGGSGESGGASTYISGSSFVLPTTQPTKVGYTFTGWYLTPSSGTVLGANYTPSSPFADITIYAQWSADNNAVIYDDQGGSGESGGAVTYLSGSNFVLPTTPPTKAGYSFTGWFLAPTGGSALISPYTPLTPFGTITIYAQWSANSNNVSYDDQGGSGESGGASTYISGSSFVLPTTQPTKVGYTFTGWYLTPSSGTVLGANYTPSSPFADITIYAQWSADNNAVIYDDQGGSGESGGAVTYLSGSNFVLPTTPPTKAGYSFTGWFLAPTGGSALISPYTPLTPFGTITIYAQWSANSNNVSYDDQGGSGESGGASTYISGSSFVLPTTQPTKVGYTFTGWYLTPSSGTVLGANYTPSSPFADITIYAQWSADNNAVIYDDQGGSGESGGAVTYLSGSNFVLPTTPPTKAGYSFTGWFLAPTGGSALISPYTPLTPFGTITIYAQWSANSNNVSYDDQGGSGESGGASTYISGSSFVLPTTQPTKVGYTFTGWYLTPSSGTVLGANYTPSSPFADITIYAQWSADNNAVIYDDQGGSGESGGAVTYLSGSNFVLPTTPPTKAGYSFTGWFLAPTGGSALISPYTPLTPFGTITIYAQWSANSNNVSYDDQGGSGESGGASTYISGSSFVLPTTQPTKVGYTFTGWYLTPSSGTVLGANYTPSSPFADITIYAQWSADNNAVIYDDQGGSGESGGAVTYLSGSNFVLPTTPPTKAGYSFTGWFLAPTGGSALISPYTPLTPFGTITIYAQWSANSNNVSYDDQGGSGESGGDVTYLSGSNFVLPITPPTQAGYTFLGWFLDPTGGSALISPYTPLTPFGNITIYAQWLINSYTVTFANNGGSGTMTAQVSSSATALTTNTFTHAGYTFTGWNTIALGGGTSYADGASYPFNADTTLYAQWSADSNAVIYDDQGGSGESGGDVTYLSGSNFVLPITPPTQAGYTFLGWFLDPTGGSALISPYTPLTPFGNITIYAQWLINSYTVTFANNGGSGTMTAQVSSSATALTTNTFTHAGYTFTGWNTIALGGGTSYADGASYPFNADTTLYAQWSADSNAVIYDDQGGSGESGGDVTYLSGSNFVLPITPPTQAGYTFLGWFLDPTGGSALISPYTPLTPFGNITIYAQWLINSYTVTFANNGGSGTMTAQVSSSATALTTNTFTHAGYTFTGWNTIALGGGTSYADGASYPFNADTTLYAQWSADSNAVIYDDQGGSGESGGDVTYLSGSNFVLPITPPTQAGYTFLGWFLDPTGGSALISPYTPLTPFGNITIYAQWLINSYTVTFANNGGSGTMTAQVSSSATALTTNTFTHAGYTFTGWNTIALGGGTSYADGASYPFNADTTLYAQWSADSNAVIYDDQGGSGESGGDVTYLSGSNFVLPITPPTQAGYTFLGWFLDPTGGSALISPYTPLTPFGNITIYAQWLINSYTVTFANNGGSGTMTAQVSSSATALTTNTFTHAGYTFTGWNTIALGGGTSYADGASYPFNADTTLYAQWSADSNAVIYDDQGGSGESGGDVTYLSGSNFVLPITPPTQAGYTFLGWFLDPTGGSALISPYTPLTPFGNITIYAQWLINSYTVTFANNGGSGTMTAQVSSSATALTTNTFTHAGYTFTGWNTIALGGGTSYADGASYPFNADTTLYAQWILNLTVTFDSQGGTGVPVTGITTVGGYLADPGVPTYLGFTFNGWFTGPTGGSALAFPVLHGHVADFTLYAHWSAVIASYTVTFANNDGSGTMTAQVSSSATALTTNTFTHAGYTFTGWNTIALGGGTSYADGASYPFNADTTLYAQWSINSYAVTYVGNGSTVGSVPVDGSSPHNFGTMVTVLGNTGNLGRTGYTFNGWNTVFDGSGLTYAPADTFAMTAGAVTLYAQWTALTFFTVTFDGNGSDGGATAPQNGNSNSPLTSSGFTRTGYTFSGWNTIAGGSGTAYSNGAMYSFTANLTLFAQWTVSSPPPPPPPPPPPATHTVHFNGNGSTGSTMADLISAAASPLTANTFTRNNFLFANWNTKADGTGTSYKDKATYPFAADATLYAQWTVIPNHTVTFDSNGGSGSMALEVENAPLALSANSFNRIGFKFAGWNTSQSGGGTTYGDGAIYAFDADVTLYAQWSANPHHTVLYAGGPAAIGAAPIPVSVPEGTTILISNNTFTHLGYIFTNWSDGAFTYNPGDTYTVGTSDLTLTAQWTAMVTTGSPFVANISAESDQTFIFNVMGLNGTLIPVTVDVPKGTTNFDGNMHISVNSTPAQNSVGLLTLSVQILDDFGTVISRLNNTFTLHFRNPLGSTVMASSADGFIWRVIPLIPSGGRTLAQDQVDGYYLDEQGNVVVVTTHLTYFGFKKLQTSKVSASVSATKLSVKGTAQIRAKGGTGTAVIRYISNTPLICSVTSRGVVKALHGGSCQLIAIKGGDIQYLSQTSAVLRVTVTGPSIIAFGVGMFREISVNLGSAYGNKSATIQYAPAGTNFYHTVTVARLNSAGITVKRGEVPNGSTLRVQVAGITVASFVVPGK